MALSCFENGLPNAKHWSVLDMVIRLFEDMRTLSRLKMIIVRTFMPKGSGGHSFI